MKKYVVFIVSIANVSVCLSTNVCHHCALHVHEIRYSMHSYELDRDFKILPSYMGHYHSLNQNRRFS